MHCRDLCFRLCSEKKQGFVFCLSWDSLSTTHVPDRHLGLRISDSTKRMKSIEQYKHIQYKLRSVEEPEHKTTYVLVTPGSLRSCDWTKRLKSHGLYPPVQQQQRSGERRHNAEYAWPGEAPRSRHF